MLLKQYTEETIYINVLFYIQVVIYKLAVLLEPMVFPLICDIQPYHA